MHWAILFQWVGTLFGVGGLTALIGRSKSQAEANKIKAEADELVWGHMKEIIERLESDVEKLKIGLESRNKQIANLTKANEECVTREKQLLKRIGSLEKQVKALVNA